jgi:TerC family integral membrane protein
MTAEARRRGEERKAHIKGAINFARLMTQEQLSIIIFGGLLVVALIFDLGLLSKKTSHITIKKAVIQTAFWVTLALGFFVFMWLQNGRRLALEYLSAYLMEWSLSIDNIFVFILIFNFFGVKEKFYARVLLVGILMAIVFRMIFIAIGIELIERFEWLLYVFGAILVYTGIRMFGANAEEEVNLEENRVYKLLKKIFPLTHSDGEGKLSIRENGKRFYTSIFAVILMLASTDIIFALDSIPAVFAISTDKLVIYTSNIFAVLGLRSLFFLLRGAVNKFSHLQQGIALVLVFIGLKMLVEIFGIHVEVYISLLVIVTSILGSIVYSLTYTAKEKRRAADQIKEDQP